MVLDIRKALISYYYQLKIEARSLKNLVLLDGIKGTELEEYTKESVDVRLKEVEKRVLSIINNLEQFREKKYLSFREYQELMGKYTQLLKEL